MSAVLKRVRGLDATCDWCRAPIIEGEVRYEHEASWTVGCSEECCAFAAQKKMQIVNGEFIPDESVTY